MFLFSSKTHKKFPGQEDNIGWFPSQQAEERQSSTSYFKMAWQKASNSNSPFSEWGGGGGGLDENHLPLKNIHHKAMPGMLGNVINTKTNHSPVTNFPASSSEQLLFCQPAIFLWATDKVRNSFVGCPCFQSWLNWRHRDDSRRDQLNRGDFFSPAAFHEKINAHVDWNNSSSSLNLLLSFIPAIAPFNDYR